MSSEISLSPPAPNSSKPPLKRSLFNRPAWAKPQVKAESRNDDTLTRSSISYNEILKEQAEIRARREARQQRRAAKVASAQERPGKRRRLSEDEDSDDHGGASSGSENEIRGVVRKDSEQRVTSKFKLDSMSPRKPQNDAEEELVTTGSTQKRSGSKPQTTIIDLEDEDEADDPISPERSASSVNNFSFPRVSNTVSGPVAKTNADDDAESDDEFAELARQAREKRRQRQLEAKTQQHKGAGANTISNGAPNGSLAPQPTPQDDPVVHILIYSHHIPNTKPLIVHRRVSQRLQEIREVWCQRQGFDADMTASVFLTWRGRKLFDVTTCKSLGIGVDGQGQVVMDGQKDMFGEGDRQIHMEAMTSEIYEEMRRARANPTAAAEREEDDKVVEKAQQEIPQIRILLKAQGFEDFKLKVKPTTTFDRIIDAFRRQRAVAPEREIFLMFDGERLAPGDKVEDSEVGDMESIDVHVK